MWRTLFRALAGSMAKPPAAERRPSRSGPSALRLPATGRLRRAPSRPLIRAQQAGAFPGGGFASGQAIEHRKVRAHQQRHEKSRDQQSGKRCHDACSWFREVQPQRPGRRDHAESDGRNQVKQTAAPRVRARARRGHAGNAAPRCHRGSRRGRTNHMASPAAMRTRARFRVHWTQARQTLLIYINTASGRLNQRKLR